MEELLSGQSVLSAPAQRIRAIEAAPLAENLGALLDEAAHDSGEQVIWDFFEEGQKETYRSLNRRVNGIAGNLLRLGIRKGTHVAVMLPNIPAFPTLWLALARIGAVMVPVNIAYRERELAFVLNDSEAEFLVIDAPLRAVIEACRRSGQVTLPVDREIAVGGEIVVDGAGSPGSVPWDELAGDPQDSFTPPEPVGPDDLLNIQYTSGTTGFPKGCMLTHRYWVVAGKVNAFRDGKHYARILAPTPFFYMDPQWLLVMTIYLRGTLFVARRQSSSRFMDWVRDLKIEFCLLPWVVHKQPPHELDAQNNVKRANVYGIPPQLHGALEARFNLIAREAFGMTEVGSAAFMPIEAVDMVGSGSCGMAGPFREIRVADEAGRSLPPGEIGELLVRGPGIMKGYFRNPEATAAAFHGDWFRTGDLFRMDERGYLYIVGRLKDMVRRSGENIAARELEAVLNALPEVLESAVIPVPDDLRGEEVKACIVLEEGRAPSPEVLDGLITHCQRHLAPFKVPRYFSFHDAFPRTASMKIAKQPLRGQGDPRRGSFDRVENRWR
jgi:acyl-CoA synthetase (AMP-forming)/AMP-acid ligase II